MTNKTSETAVRPIPGGYGSVTPWIIVKGVNEFIGFIKEAFGAVELYRVSNADGSIGHAEARIGDSIVMMFDSKDDWQATPCFLRLYVEDGDAVYEQALKAGAVSVTEMTFLSFGDRVGRVCDPWGNIWWIQTRVENVPFEEMESRASEPGAIKNMQYVQETLDRELSRRGR